jgi:chromosome segregation ATPase
MDQIIKKENEEKDDEINNLKLDLYNKINKINENEDEINKLKNNLDNKDKAYKLKINIYEKEIDFLKSRINELEKENEDLRNRANTLEKLTNQKNKNNKDKLLEDEINKLKIKNDLLNKDIDNLNEQITNLQNKANNQNDNYNNFDKNEDYEEKYNSLKHIIEELKNKNQLLILVLNNLKRNNINNQNINQDDELKKYLFFLLTQKYIDKNIIFDKNKFLKLLLEKNFKQSNRNLRTFNNNFNRQYRTADNSLDKIFKPKYKEKKFEYLRDSLNREQHY